MRQEQDPSKSLILANSLGEHSAYSVEDILARRLNGWKGWTCSAGVDNIHITADGNVFAASCKVGGLLGNVYDDRIVFNANWTVCTKAWCMCGSDMQLRKARTADLMPLTYEPPDGPERPIDNVEFVAPAHYDAHADFPKTVTWDLSRRCNYACSYCHPALSNRYEAPKSWGSLKHATDLILANFAGDKKVKWIFTDGEPTIIPSFMTLVRYLREAGHLLHTQSNGSVGARYFSELIKLSCTGLSLHLESYDHGRFLETCQAIVETKKTDATAALMWFGVRIMVPPGFVNRAREVREEIRCIPGFQEVGHVHLSPLFERVQADVLMQYAPEELTMIKEFS